VSPMSLKTLAGEKRLPPPAARRAIRLAAGLTLAEVGRSLEVSRQTVWRWEEGHREPRGETRLAYARALRELRDDSL
jgi:transcriptional regulator with XRE-family HTH domain